MELLIEKVQGGKEEILSQLADMLLKKEIVKQGYKEALLEREKRFPTGLWVSEDVRVAIPHTDIAFARKNALVVAEPLAPVSFFRMDKPDESIFVNMVFLMVVNDANKYTDFLRKFTEKLTDKTFVGLIKSKDLDKVAQYVKKEMLM